MLRGWWSSLPGRGNGPVKGRLDILVLLCRLGPPWRFVREGQMVRVVPTARVKSERTWILEPRETYTEREGTLHHNPG